MVSIPSQFDELEVGIVLHDAHTGEILYANPFAENLYGYSAQELSEMGVGDISSEPFSEAEALQRIRAAVKGRSQQFEWRIKRPTGELFWIEVRLSTLTIDNTKYVAAIVQDITEHKMNLRHLRILTRITRHNLRNKLNVIEGAFEYIDDRTGNNEMFDRIRRSISELLHLTSWIDTIKSVNRIDSSTKKLDICQLVTDLGETYRKEYPEIDWQFECKQAYVTADSTLRTAIKELIDNAVTHNPHDELEIDVTVTECISEQQVHIEITDTGQQIPEIEIEPLIGGYDPDPLEHGENVGLWEVQTIINAHGGRLSITENISERKTLKIILPRATT